MKLTDYLLAEIEAEAGRTTRALTNYPDGKHEWKPHEKSLTMGYIAQMVATIPSWAAMAVTQDELDLQPPGGSKYQMPPMLTSAALLEGHEKALQSARQALSGTTDEFLMTPWKLLVNTQVVMQQPRHEVIRDTINHMIHHRGQLTVYYRLAGATVPALYGPSADDKRFT
jgi:uncharacterized damage-inducible protein DinB